MELDKRIKEGKRPLNCFDTEQAKQFIGKKCYFSDDARDFMNLDKADGDTLFYVAELQNIWTAEEYCFADNSNDWRFILPFEWVKPEESEEPEKKYRPLSYKDFWRLFDFGDGVCFRRKGQDTAEFSMLLGYEIDSDGNRAEIPGEGKVNLGGNRYTLAELFEYYEMQLDGEWQPFGVIDEQGATE